MEGEIKEIKVNLKALTIKVQEIYDWMELTQNKTLERLSKQLIDQKKELNKLIKKYDK